ncbi:aspartyl-phosphate phosphatase Spo0E family protein [Neobacillus drentensis]|uniref:aspartyl-phosphate phosphatase Spo0E family protein n=1 Tax=Neobacillus drentensis TaxID=220684 RepID=UPI00300069B5
MPFYIKHLTGMLEIIIEKKRIKLIALANQYGLSAQETVQVSKELDQLIIIYQKNLIS